MKKYQGLLAILITAVIIATTYYWINSHDRYLKDNGVRVIGVTSETGGKNVTVSFLFLGSQHTVVVGQSNGSLRDGEFYNVLINKDNPSDCLVKFDSPVFDKKLYHSSSILTLKKLPLSNTMQFSYAVDGKNYQRFQSISADVDVDRQKKNARLFVNKSDPRISYILFGKGG